MCVCVCVCACVRACVRARVRACVRARVRASSSGFNWPSSNLYREVGCLECGKVKHERVLRLTLLASALLQKKSE